MKGKYHFFDHRSNELAIYKKMPKNFLDKLLSYPITAFGYRFVDFQEYINPKFEKHEVIKALDFWIQYWVYKNKCDYILEGTVNQDFELTVRELIETREAVLKCTADTQFVRNKIRVGPEPDSKNFNWQMGRYYYRYQNGIVDTNMRGTEITKYSKKYNLAFPRPKPLFQPAVDQMIEFTENVVDSSNSSVVSTVDQFCYKVVKMTYKEYMNRNQIKGTIKYDYSQNFRDDNRFDFTNLMPTGGIDAVHENIFTATTTSALAGG
jgi:hypothetical protein